MVCAGGDPAPRGPARSLCSVEQGATVAVTNSLTLWGHVHVASGREMSGDTRREGERIVGLSSLSSRIWSRFSYHQRTTLARNGGGLRERARSFLLRNFSKKPDVFTTTFVTKK